MDVQLEELLDRIKSEGVDAAEKKAAEIVDAAQTSSKQIVAGAEQRAAQIIAEAEAQAEKLERTGKEALSQAGRDLLLNIQSKIADVFQAVIREEASSELTGDLLGKAIISVVQQLSSAEATDASVLLPSEEFERLESGLRSKLAEKIRQGLEIKPSDSIDTGFRVTVEGGAAYYNFSAEEIAAILAERLNPKLAELLRSAVS